MKHTQGELLDIVYRHYPRGVGMVDGDIDIQLIHASEEHARLVAAQQKVVTDGARGIEPIAEVLPCLVSGDRAGRRSPSMSRTGGSTGSRMSFHLAVRVIASVGDVLGSRAPEDRPHRRGASMSRIG